MRMYSTKLRIIMPIEVKADSLEEAIRLIDGVVNNVGEIVVYEGRPDEFDDSLHGNPERIERDEITTGVHA